MEQKQNNTCVAVAIINACRYLELDDPNFDDLTKELHCRNGGAIGTKSVIKRIFGDRLVECNNFHEFSKTGGILTILHPLFNLHTLFCYPEDEGFILVNSWLGPNIMRNIGYNEIAYSMLPRHAGQQEFWKLNQQKQIAGSNSLINEY